MSATRKRRSSVPAALKRRSERSSKSEEGVERRRFNRRSILESFGVTIVLPDLGERKLWVRDLSEDGIGISLDSVGGLPGRVDAPPFKVGRKLKASLYLNQSLRLPLELEIVRLMHREITPDVEGEGAGSGTLSVGARWSARESGGYAALLCFLQLIDRMGTVGLLEA